MYNRDPYELRYISHITLVVLQCRSVSIICLERL